MSCEQLFRNELKKKGLRLTEQRKLVLDVLHQTESSLTIDEIYQKISLIDPAVDVSTVYRTLDLLTEIGLAQEIHSHGRQHLYHLSGTRAPHIHLVCQKCGMISALDLDLFEEVRLDIYTQIGFNADLAQVTIPGLCSKCQE